MKERPVKYLSAKMSDHQKDIFQALLARVVRDRNNLTPETRRQFWELVDEIGAPQKDVDTLKDLLAGPIVIYMNYFFQDALIALKDGKPYKSKERAEYEQYLKSLEAMTDDRIAANDELMEQIAYKRPIQQGEQSGVMDEAMLQRALLNVKLAVDSITTLFTRPG